MKDITIHLRLESKQIERIDSEAEKNAETQAEAIRHLIEDGFKYRQEPSPILSRRAQEYVLQDSLRRLYSHAANHPEYAEFIKRLNKKVGGAVAFKIFLLVLLASIALLIVSLAANGQLFF